MKQAPDIRGGIIPGLAMGAIPWWYTLVQKATSEDGSNVRGVSMGTAGVWLEWD